MFGIPNQIRQLAHYTSDGIYESITGIKGIAATRLLYVNEIKDSKFMVVSTGTGTACVGYLNKKFTHLGGISIGGGTLQGLSKLTIDTNKPNEIEELAIIGDKNNLDSLIGEVVNNIGALDPEITASNFSKASILTCSISKVTISHFFPNS